MKRCSLQWRAAVVAVLIGGATAQASVTVIDTISGWDNVYNVNSFGEGTTPTYGQTVTVPADNMLDSFTFKLGHGGDIPTTVRFFVMAWDGNKVSGPVLFQTGPTTLIQSQFYQDYTVMTGGLPLVTGNQYALFFTSLLDFDGVNDASLAAARHHSTDPYLEGRFVLNNGATSLAGLAANGWQIDFLGTGDLAFRAEFSSFPTGDYNHNGVVDAADYVVWRKTNGSQTDYNDWRSHFDQPPGSGAAGGSGATGGAPSGYSPVPEPATLVLLVTGMLAMCARRRTDD